MSLTSKIGAEAQLQSLLDGVESGKMKLAEMRRLAAPIREHLVAKREREAERQRKKQERLGYTLRLRLRITNPRTGVPEVTVPKAGPIWETDYFRCMRFGDCLTEVRTCLLRQGARWPGGNRCKDGSVREKKAGVHPYCASGSCEQGHDLFVRCAFRPEAVWSKGRYRFFREDSHEQRERAKKLRMETPPTQEERADLSPFQEAAMLTKDEPIVKTGG